MKDLKTPDITPAQVAGVGIVMLGIGFGEGFDNDWIMAAALGIGVALMLADAIIRAARSLMAGNKFSDEDLDL